MITLNLTAKNTEQEVVKQYLEENAKRIRKQNSYRAK